MPASTSRESSAARRARFVERFGSALTAAGMQRLPSRVFASLLADEDGRMTAAQIGEQLSVSAASVSGAVRSLEQMRLIHRERQPGSRRDVYVVADDAWHDVMISPAATYDPLTAVLREGVGLVGGPQSPAGQRLALSVAFLEFITEELDGIARRWEVRRNRLVR
ncbi:GbsR/MarR family transcriptional regulator [Pedococcus sp. 5OH_020]|uniref:GbsR/MarR family transcriptional regulator n=1 Tax=Pedococcus sp. 5OH_020 TaxID=2989814 RepID=UPI0022E9F54F|nr:MarR family transcriptional regulator [Pedococcus sp. 5OH_020]